MTRADIGDHIHVCRRGREVSKIASIRKINWDSFQPNFFMVMSPGALDGMPTTYISSLRIEEPQQAVLVTLVRSHPSISVIDIDAILQQLRGIIEKASLPYRRCSFSRWRPVLPCCLRRCSRRSTSDVSKARCCGRLARANAPSLRASWPSLPHWVRRPVFSPP